MAIIWAWQNFTRRHPIVVMFALTAVFAIFVCWVYALESTAYYNNNRSMPGALFGAIIALYLTVTFVVGLVTPLRAGDVGPVVAYAAVTLLWPLTPGESYDSLTYDSGWVGAVMAAVVPSVIIWFVAYAGRKMGKPGE